MRPKVTTQEIIHRVKDAMKVLGIKDHLPTVNEMIQYGKLNQVLLKRVGGVKGISLMLGLPPAPVKKPSNAGRPRKIEKAQPVDKKEILSMEDVTPSQAFSKQKQSGIPYGQMQRQESLDKAGKIDIDAYRGMTSYAERKHRKNGKKQQS